MKTLVLTMLIIFTLVISAGAYTLSWTGSEGATGYRIYYNDINTPEDITMVDKGQR